MAVLQPSEYDMAYFDGSLGPYRHNAGYSEYKRWYRNEGEGSTGEFWKDMAAGWINHLALSGKRVLEIGCAKGFLVKDLRDMGVDAYGLDVSQYAIENCEPEVAQYLTVGDARTYLSNYARNEWDIVLSLRFLECIDEADLPALVSEINRISKKSVHVVDNFVGAKSGAGQYYTQHTPQEWLDNYSWERGTVIVPQEDRSTFLTK